MKQTVTLLQKQKSKMIHQLINMIQTAHSYLCIHTDGFLCWLLMIGLKSRKARRKVLNNMDVDDDVRDLKEKTHQFQADLSY